MKSLTLKCSSCNAALEVTPDMDRFACGYCGTEQIVQRRGGTVVLKAVVDAIERVQTGIDRTAAELAFRRISEEIATLELEAHQINAVRKTHVSPAAILSMGGIGSIGSLIAMSAGWDDAPVFLVVAVSLLLLGLGMRYQKDPGKIRLEELRKTISDLTTKRDQYKSIIEP